MADVDNRLDREDGTRTMGTIKTDYTEFEKQQLEDWLELCHEFLDGQNTPRDEGKGAVLTVYGRLVKYATNKNKELAALRERAEKAEAERDALKEANAHSAELLKTAKDLFDGTHELCDEADSEEWLWKWRVRYYLGETDIPVHEMPQDMKGDA